MEPPAASRALYETLQAYQLLLLAAVRSLWAGMLPSNFDGSWARIAPTLVSVAAGAQLAAATAGARYVPEVLAETGQPDEPMASIRPGAFAGVASDGRSLPGLLEGSVRVAKAYSARGLDGPAALAVGGRWLDRTAVTIATDAARDAIAAEIMVRQSMRWVRMVNPPCCSRCAVLAGATYSWKADFPRHPQCDCLAIPVTEANDEDYRTNPRALYDQGLITDLSKAQRARIDDGDDLPKVLNESRDRWRQRLADQRKADKASNRALKRASWTAGADLPPPGTSIHDLFDRLTGQVEATRALKAAGIAD